MKCPKCQFDNPNVTNFCGKCGVPLTADARMADSLTKTLVTPPPAISKDAIIAGKYKIIEELGRGGMGIVYKAEDIRLKRTVALKFLPPELTHIPEVKDRFMREAQAAAALDHPNICTVYEFDQAGENAFISMAFIEGQSLRKRIDSGPLKLEEALKIAMQIAEGLQEAHRNGIVHRDLKSANVMVTARGQAKVMDFGLAKTMGATLVTREGTTMGTVTYMSPEQARGEKVDHRTDIWSFGVVLYEMLSGELPFKGEHEQAIIHSILKESPRSIKDLKADVPASIEQVVFRALEKNPDKRYQRIGDLLDDLRSLAAGIVPDEIQVRLRRAKLTKRKRAILYAGAAGSAVIAIIAALSLLSGRAAAIDSIAVLPLENRTGDAKQDYYVDGVTEELIGHLAQISGLRRVISRTTVMRYKDTHKSLPEIARELNVDALVEGTVHRVGENVRLQLQVFDALPEERNLLAETYERAGTDVLMMYGEIARAIAGRLHVKLTAEEETRFVKARQVDPEAYAACLQGMSHWYKLTPADLDAAQGYFESALEEDPNYALAHTGMGLVLFGRAQMGLIPPGKAREDARPFLSRALELDDSLPEAQFAMAGVKTWLEWDFEGGEAAFLRTIELKPSYAMARVYYSNLLCILKRYDEAAAQGKRALELDPLNSLVMGIYANSMIFMGRYDDAVVQGRKALRTSPNDPIAHTILWETLHLKRQYNEALGEAKAFYAALELTPVVEAMSRGYESGGYRGAMRAAAETLAAIFQQGAYFAPFMIAYPYAAAGETEKALEWLAKGIEVRDQNMPYILPDHSILQEALSGDPRFQALMRRVKPESAGKK